MKITYEAVSHVGLLRSNNEDMALVMGIQVRDGADAFSTTLPDGQFVFSAIVCDGLGGYEGGEVASQMACGLFAEWVDALPADLQVDELIMRLKQWAREANGAILDAARGNRMGCTLTGLLLYYDQAFILNMGDSRTYRLRFDTLKQLTTDHSERLRTGDMSIPASTIYNCLGLDDAFIDVTPTRVVAGDCFIICSDGLCDMVSDEAIAANASSAQAEVDVALAAGGRDNVTVIRVAFE